DLRGVLLFDDLGGGVGAVEQRHGEIHQDDVRLQAQGGLDRGAAAGDLADDPDVGLGLEQQAQAVADHGVVVGDQYGDGHAASQSPFARLTTTVVPRASPDAMRSSAPIERARSAMIARPQPPPAGACCAGGSPIPTPSSATVSAMPVVVRSSPMLNSLASACLATLIRASWAMRNKVVSTWPRSRGKLSLARQRKAMPVRPENSSPCQRSAVVRPYCSSSAGCNSSMTPRTASVVCSTRAS